MEQTTIEKEESGISILDLLKMLKKHLILLLIVVFATTAVAFVYGYKIKDITYTSSGTLVSQIPNDTSSNPTMGYNNTVTAILLTNSFVELVKTEKVGAAAAEKLNSKRNGKIVDPLTGLNYGDLSSNYNAGMVLSGVSVSVNTDSAVISVRYSSLYPVDAVLVLNELLEACVEVVDEYDAANSTYAYPSYANNLKIWDKANRCSGSRSWKLITLVGAVLGCVVSFVIIFLLEMFNDGIKDKDDFESIVGVNVIATIPFVEEKGGKK